MSYEGPHDGAVLATFGVDGNSIFTLNRAGISRVWTI
jgi:hypothetical protein